MLLLVAGLLLDCAVEIAMHIVTLKMGSKKQMGRMEEMMFKNKESGTSNLPRSRRD